MRRFGVGDVAQFRKDHVRVPVEVRWVGNVIGSEKIHVGFELTDPGTPSFALCGTDMRDGTHLGQRYFDCEPGRGHIVLQSQLSKRSTKTVRSAARAAADRRSSAVSATPAQASDRILPSELVVGMKLWHTMKLAPCVVKWLGNLASERVRLLNDDGADGADDAAGRARDAAAPVDIFVEFFTNVGDAGTDSGSGMVFGSCIFANPRRDCCHALSVESACAGGILRRLDAARTAVAVALEQKRVAEDEAVAAEAAVRRQRHEAFAGASAGEAGGGSHGPASDDFGDDDDEEGVEEEMIFTSARKDDEATLLAREQQSTLKRWLQKEEYHKIHQMSNAIFSAMDWDDDGDLSFEEFEASWFKGQHKIVGDPAKSKRHTEKAIRKLGGSNVTHTITREAFQYNIVKKYVSLPPHQHGTRGKDRRSFEQQLANFVASAFEEKEHQILHARNAAKKAELATAAMNEKVRSVGLKMQVAKLRRENAALGQSAAMVPVLRNRLRKSNVAKMGLKMRLHSRVAIGGGGGAAGVAAGMSAEDQAQWMRDVQAKEQLEQKVEDLALEKAQAVEANALLEAELRDMQAAMAALREKASQEHDWTQPAQLAGKKLRAALIDVPSTSKALMEAVADLEGATRVMVVVRPFLPGNPDELMVRWKPCVLSQKKTALKGWVLGKKSTMYRYVKKRYGWSRASGVNMRKWLNDTEGELREKFELARRATSVGYDSGVGPYCSHERGAADCIFYVEHQGHKSLQLLDFTKGGKKQYAPSMYAFTDLMPYNGPFQVNSRGALDLERKDEQASQEVIWSRVQPLISSVCRQSPHNACVFAYGGTGSGKTFTMGAVPEKDELAAKLKEENAARAEDPTRGPEIAKGAAQLQWEAEAYVQEDHEVFFSTAACLLRECQAQTAEYTGEGTVDFELEFRVADNYQNSVFDLNEPDSVNRGPEIVAIGATGDPLFQFFTPKPFTTKLGFWTAFKEAVSRRRVAAGVNAVSSRSHLVLGFSVKRTEKVFVPTEEVILEVRSQAVVIDLAGAESEQAVQERLDAAGADKAVRTSLSLASRTRSLAHAVRSPCPISPFLSRLSPSHLSGARLADQGQRAARVARY